MPFFLAERHHFSVLVEGHSRNIPVKLFQDPFISLGGDVSEVNCCRMHDSLHPFSFFLALVAILFSQNRTILAILVKGHKRNISVKLF